MGIGRVIKEIRESAPVILPGRIAEVAALEEVELTPTFTVYDWWQAEADLVKLKFPALSVMWDGSSTQLRRPHGRPGKHRIIVSYGYRSLNLAEIQRHVLYVPDAILAWFDDFPVVSRAPNQGRQILAVAGGEADAIEITHDVMKADATTGFIWTVDLAITVHATTPDGALPARL